MWALLFVGLLFWEPSGWGQMDPDKEAQESFQSGINALLTGSYEVALAQFKRAIERNPTEFSYFVELGNTYSILGNYAAAENTLTQATKLNPRYAGVWQSLAIVYRIQKRNDDASKALIEAIGIDDSDGTTWARLGATYFCIRCAGSVMQREPFRVGPNWSQSVTNPTIGKPSHNWAQTKLRRR